MTIGRPSRVLAALAVAALALTAIVSIQLHAGVSSSASPSSTSWLAAHSSPSATSTAVAACSPASQRC